MSLIWSKEVDSVLGLGVSLESLGVNNWALSKADAINAIEKLEEMGVPLLGGDVYRFIDGVIEQNYDSWYCDQVSDEPNNDFLRRSLAVAKKYIESYMFSDALFALVPRVSKERESR